ncbi:capsular exopolysaccharide family [Chishuiella changwenlii]|uniref:Capsular exopolysaccharide family n=1 Tax=Chishuiella changwenlii TaxID=1434701 RepID=A0A1M7A4N8_9FLAO|nr:polysaccharide biosynthesis tyrosine autokinase [Chishuiella changwenlii]GGE91634.1 tyrosine protein kinase [Chishuiella changwenlii]SHL37698.1 capsular exopolysaccharide family [Chishuiella changwenlii]
MNTQNKYKENTFSEEIEENINIRQLIEQYLYYWKWFVLGLILAITIAIIYVKTVEKQYKVSSKILLNDKDAGGKGDIASMMDQALLGGSSLNAEVGDQIDILKSKRLITKVVQKNNLNIEYFDSKGIVKKQLYETNSPVKIILIHKRNEEVLNDDNFIIKVLSNTKFKLENKQTKDEKEYSFGQKITGELGNYIISPNHNISENIDKKIILSITTVDKKVAQIQKAIVIEPNSESSSKIINFSLIGAVPEISKIVINDLVTAYNNDIVEDEQKLTQTTSKFINSRLEIVSKDLSDSDKNIEDYKVKNKITDIGSEAGIFLESAAENDKKLLESTTQVQLVNYMSNELNSSKTNLLPSNIGLDDKAISAEISSYNELILTKEDMLKSVTVEHPNVIKLQEQINDVKRNLKNSLRLYKNNTQTMLNSIQSKQNQIEGRIQKVPTHERGFRNIARQQQIVESLYLFLLQKREENEIKSASTPQNIKIVDYAYEDKIPVAPKKIIILGAALILGFLIPFIIIYIYKLLNNTVHSKEDVEKAVGAPIAGQIPKSNISIIENNDNSSASEAFRILRTNINFLLKNTNDSKAIFITSTTSGEGKSFVSTNFAQILTMSGKSVLLIGADIRSPKVLDYLGITSEYNHRYGVTEYLSSKDVSMDDIIIKKPANYKFDVIYSGQIAPNPSELLMNGRFDEIVQYGKQHYDYVLVDTAPVSLVTDTLLLTESADLTMYVVRAHYLDKRMLAVPREMYTENRIKNMSMVINDVDFSKGYGYGYGYGYGDHHNGNNFFKKLFKRK